MGVNATDPLVSAGIAAGDLLLVAGGATPDLPVSYGRVRVRRPDGVLVDDQGDEIDVASGGTGDAGPVSTQVTGNLPSTFTFNAEGLREKWLRAAISGPCAITLTNLTPGAKATLFLTRAAAGAVTLTDGVADPVAAPTSATVGSVSVVEVYNPGGSSLIVLGVDTSTGGTTPAPTFAASDYMTVVAEWDASVLAGAGAPVSLLADKGGNFNAVQGAAGMRPTSQTAGGIKVVRFDGDDDRLETTLTRADLGASGVGRPYTLLAVVNPTDYSAARGGSAIIGASGAGGLVFRFEPTTGKPQLVNAGTAVIATGTAAPDPGELSVVSLTLSAANTYEFRLNGTVIGAGTVSNSDINATPLWLGGTTFNEDFLGDMAYVAIGKTVMNTPGAVHAALMSKYGIS